MSVEKRVSTGPFCVALGCRSDAEVIVFTQDHGERPVCKTCANADEVIRDV